MRAENLNTVDIYADYTYLKMTVWRRDGLLGYVYLHAPRPLTFAQLRTVSLKSVRVKLGKFYPKRMLGTFTFAFVGRGGSEVASLIVDR